MYILAGKIQRPGASCTHGNAPKILPAKNRLNSRICSPPFASLCWVPSAAPSASSSSSSSRAPGALLSAAALLGAFGLARRLSEEGFRPGTLVRHGGDVAQVVRHTARGSRRENFFVVLLDVRSRVMGLHQVSTGVVDSAPVHPREVFGPAVREAAVAVVIAHNHPSGDPSPSKQDHEVTERLRTAGALLGIDMLDHVVVGTDRYYSFADEAFFAYS